MANYDWDAIRREYVEAPSEQNRPSLNALADKHGCGRSTLKVRAKKEDWEGQAKDFLKDVNREKQQIRQERRKVRVDAVAMDQASWDEQCYTVAQLALERIQEHLNGSEDLTLKNLDDLAKALEKIHKLGKAAIGEAQPEISTIDSTQYEQMEAEDLARLYLERTKQST